MKLDNIQMFGLAKGLNTVTVNGQTVAFDYNADTKVLLTYFT